jgi:hypothetical protein
MLSLLNAALLTELIVISLSDSLLKTPALTLWYRRFGIGAVIADVSILVLGVLVASFIYPYLFDDYGKYSMIYFIGVVLLVQLTHDLLFGFFISRYQGNSPFIGVFKQYIKEVGPRILLVDALMMISTVLLEKVFDRLLYNDGWAVLLVYAMPYLVFSV